MCASVRPSVAESSASRSPSSIRFGLLSEVLAVLLTGMFVVGGALAIFGDGLMILIGSVWLANVLMLAIIYAGLRRRGQDWTHFGLSFRWSGRRSAIRAVAQSMGVFVFATASFVVAAILMANLVGMPEPADMSQYNALSGNLGLTLMSLASVYLVSSFAEEVIYRGFMITRLRESFGSGKVSIMVAVLCSSMVFGLVHSEWGIAGMVQASFMGIALGVSYLAFSRNLWVTILAHAYMDTLLVVQMYLR